MQSQLTICARMHAMLYIHADHCLGCFKKCHKRPIQGRSSLEVLQDVYSDPKGGRKKEGTYMNLLGLTSWSKVEVIHAYLFATLMQYTGLWKKAF